MKFFKKLFIYATLTWAGFYAYKKISQSKEVFKLSKSLPKYLETVVDCKNKLTVNLSMGKTLTIKVGFKKEEVDQVEIESIILEYIEDFYPALAKLRIDVDIYTIEVEEENAEECGCGCTEEKTEPCNCDDENCDCDEHEGECDCNGDCKKEEKTTIEEVN